MQRDWEIHARHEWEDSSSDEIQTQPADEFLDELLDPFFNGEVSARYVCVLCFWLSKLGCSEKICKLFSLRASRRSLARAQRLGHRQRPETIRSVV